MELSTTVKTENVDNGLNVTTSNTNRQPKNNKRKKIRRLADTTIDNKPVSKCKRLLIFTGIFTFTIALLMGHYFTQNNENTKHIIREFLKNYRNHYTQILHGKQNYCDQKQQLDTQALFERVKQYRILHQEKPLQQIEVALRNESDLNAIALVGSVGVGKSLFMRSMVENFPWQENVHTYSWNTYVKEEADKFHLIRLMIENLSECGQNLMVIENMRPCDRGVVEIVNKLVMESVERQQKRVVIFYVFNLNTMLEQEKYNEEKNVVQTLNECIVIDFNSFSENELKDCILREVDLENLTLSSQDFDEIVATIDPTKSGCKNVNAKVLMYGNSKTKDNL